MSVNQFTDGVRLGLCAGVAGLALMAAGGASAQAYSGYYPAPPAYAQGYDYPAQQPYAQSPYQQDRYADPRYEQPSYESYQDPRAADPRYADPRYMSPQQARAYARWYSRYYGGYAANNAPQSGYAQPPMPRQAPVVAEGPANAPPPPPPPPSAAPVVAPASVAQPAPLALLPMPAAAVAAPVAAAVPAIAAVPVEPPAPAPEPIRVVARAEAAVPGATLPHKLIEAAEAYADYVTRATAINAAFKSGASVAEAVKTGAAFEPHQFEEGAIAYAALTAMQESEFVQGVRTLMAEGDQGQLFAEQLAMQPQAVLNIRGADLAVARAAAALHRHGQHLVGVGAQVKQAAYDVQKADWSKAQVSDPDGRLAAAKVESSTRSSYKDDMEPLLKKAVIAETAEGGQAPVSPVVVRGLAIAALAALGQLRGDEDPHLFTLLAEPKSADCLKMAKLNLFQCLSVARPHYEDIFCLGEHAMMETGQCVVKAAGYTPVPVTMARASTGTSGRK